MRATLSVLGLYNYDPSIFDGFRTPDGIDRDTMIQTILQECAELEIVYPSAPVMRRAIDNWTRQEFDVWARLQSTTQYKYDPISNYDRTEEWDESQTTKGISSANGENSVVGFNGADPVQADASESSSSFEGEGANKRRGRAYGNIGVTTTQQMIQQERDISTFCPAHYILQSFKHHFCLLVY